MRRSVLRWLLRRGRPKLKPLCTRTSWGDFEHRFRPQIARDIRILLGEPLPQDYDERPTARLTQVLGWHNTVTVVDEYQTQPMEV